MRGVRVGAKSRAPVAAAILPARARGASRVARPPRMRAVLSLDFRISAAAAMAASPERAYRMPFGGAIGSLGRSCATSFQAASAGRMRQATRPGALRAAATAAAPSAASVSAPGEVRTQWLKGRAAPSMSEVRGASRCR